MCSAERYALLTNNVGDFTAITRRWSVNGQRHAGLIFTSDAGLPRTRATIGSYVRLLDELLTKHQEAHAFLDRVHWL